MSLGMVVKSPEGIVLAAESRVTLNANSPQGLLVVSFDNATKLLSFSHPNAAVGAVTYGIAAIGQRTAQSYVPEFESTVGPQVLRVEDFAAALGIFYAEKWAKAMPTEWDGPQMTFLIAGINPDEPYGRVFEVNIPGGPSPVEQQPGLDVFGITWGGQREIVDRLIQGFDARLPDIAQKVLNLTKQDMAKLAHAAIPLQLPIPIQAMPLQDCVDLAIFFIRTTIAAQRLTVGIRGCGGPIDLAIITKKDGLRFVQKKEILGEHDDGARRDGR